MYETIEAVLRRAGGPAGLRDTVRALGPIEAERLFDELRTVVETQARQAQAPAGGEVIE